MADVSYAMVRIVFSSFLHGYRAEDEEHCREAAPPAMAGRKLHLVRLLEKPVGRELYEPDHSTLS
jgi:hypothetical protein